LIPSWPSYPPFGRCPPNRIKLSATGDAYAAEPFIGHFLWEYCGHFPDRMSAFGAITRRTPFHMGITLLRIARNSWIDWEYRWRLVGEAKAILRALPC
jgi:hypothetical protein